VFVQLSLGQQDEYALPTDLESREAGMFHEEILRYIVIGAALCVATPICAQSTDQLYSLHPKPTRLLLAAAQDAAPGCRPGDIEIGRQETADEIIVYCSRVSCEKIASRVKQDIDAAKAPGLSTEQRCKLDRLLKIDVRNMNVCNGKLPAPDAPDPESLRCARESSMFGLPKTRWPIFALFWRMWECRSDHIQGC
jgi:hypothetical protein